VTANASGWLRHIFWIQHYNELVMLPGQLSGHEIKNHIFTTETPRMLHRLMAWLQPKPAHFPQPEDILGF